MWWIDRDARPGAPPDEDEARYVPPTVACVCGCRAWRQYGEQWRCKVCDRAAPPRDPGARPPSAC
jgi:hypothetical protein